MEGSVVAAPACMNETDTIHSKGNKLTKISPMSN
jgi:hypothetical protein